MIGHLGSAFPWGLWRYRWHSFVLGHHCECIADHKVEDVCEYVCDCGKEWS